MELAWRSGSVMPNRLPCDGPGFDSQWERCKTELHVLCKGQ